MTRNEAPEVFSFNFCLISFQSKLRNTIFRNFRDPIAGRWAVTQVIDGELAQYLMKFYIVIFKWKRRLFVSFLQEELPSSQAMHYPPNLKVNLFLVLLHPAHHFLPIDFHPPCFWYSFLPIILLFFKDWLLPTLLHWLLLHAHTSHSKQKLSTSSSLSMKIQPFILHFAW